MIIKSNEIAEFDNLKPGNYMVRIIIDENENDRWDAGNYMDRKQPEKVIIFEKSLSLKANWELEENINLSSE